MDTVYLLATYWDGDEKWSHCVFRSRTGAVSALAEICLEKLNDENVDELARLTGEARIARYYEIYPHEEFEIREVQIND